MVNGGISTVNILSGDYFDALTLKLTSQHINQDHNCSVNYNADITLGAEQSSITLYRVPWHLCYRAGSVCHPCIDQCLLWEMKLMMQMLN